jgi:hypothetical protein
MGYRNISPPAIDPVPQLGVPPIKPSRFDRLKNRLAEHFEFLWGESDLLRYIPRLIETCNRTITAYNRLRAMVPDEAFGSYHEIVAARDVLLALINRPIPAPLDPAQFVRISPPSFHAMMGGVGTYIPNTFEGNEVRELQKVSRVFRKLLRRLDVIKAA